MGQNIPSVFHATVSRNTGASANAQRKNRLANSIRESFEYLAGLIAHRHPQLAGGFGFVDGVHLPVEVAGEENVQNAYYNGWLCSHFINNIFVFGPNGAILHCVLNCPGSWHDAVVAQPLYQHLIHCTPNPYYIIADAAFPSKAALSGRIKMPLSKDFTSWPADPGMASDLRMFNRQLKSARQSAEWGMRSLQGSFGRPRIPLPSDDVSFRQLVLVLCCRLFQIRARVVGISEIQAVYERIWLESGIYAGFQDLRFREILFGDRIRQYYNLSIG